MSNINDETKTIKLNEMKTNTGTCTNCGKNTIYCKGLCVQCYKAQWYQNKKASMPLNLERKPIGRPPIDGVKTTECVDCGAKAVYARGRCYKCYKRAYQRGSITSEGIDSSYQRPRTTNPATGEKKICSYCGLHPVYGNNLCRTCNTRAKRNGGDPAYKNRGCARTMKNKQLLKKRWNAAGKDK